MEETSQYVVSSYTPTVNALLEARAAKPQKSDRLSCVAMTDTLGLNPLPNAEIELIKIRRMLLQNSTWKFEEIRNEEATEERVLEAMSRNGWVHLACHAIQDTREPTQSGFHLNDGRLTITDIIKKPFVGADFAFLSACETATGDENAADEAAHLTGAMLGAGYRSLIGTMWAIPDATAPLVAEKVYKKLFDGGIPDSGRAARALHGAVKEIRRESPSGFYSWIPFVHYGV